MVSNRTFLAKSRKLIGVYGASGFGREVLPLVRRSRPVNLSDLEEIVFVDDAPTTEVLNGHRVLTFDSLMAEASGPVSIILAIADARARERLYQKCRAVGVEVLSVQASNAEILEDVTLGEGSIICSFVTLTSNIKVGRCFHANLYSYIAHDCVIGDYVTFAPGVHCNGNVVVEDYAYVGAGAVIRQGKPGTPMVIGRGATVGMGAVVTKNVLPGSTVVGNPARVVDSKPKAE
jgi:sugar O-acyltransferase (sialic acid O-acetyltransferase NeuD family)